MSGSQSLERGLAVLELVDTSATPLGVREIARQVGLSPAITQRLVNTLCTHRYLRQHEDTRRYSIGYRALTLGTSLTRTDSLIVAANAELQKIAGAKKLNGYLGILRANRAVYLLAVQSEGPVAIRNEPGETTYLHTTAMGKVLLAALSDEQASILLGPGPLQRITDATKIDPVQILEELQAIRLKGYAEVVDENILGVNSLGAPIYDATGQVRAALSVAYARHFEPDMSIEQAAAIVKAAAERISQALGYRPGMKVLG